MFVKLPPLVTWDKCLQVCDKGTKIQISIRNWIKWSGWYKWFYNWKNVYGPLVFELGEYHCNVLLQDAPFSSYMLAHLFFIKGPDDWCLDLHCWWWIKLFTLQCMYTNFTLTVKAINRVQIHGLYTTHDGSFKCDDLLLVTKPRVTSLTIGILSCSTRHTSS